ncbi:hypothetical protein J6V86_03685 [bacterium]|nr:hypothetical protein [bacterium]
MVPYIPKVADKLRKLALLQKEKPEATLLDIVTSKYVRYEMKSNSVK